MRTSLPLCVLALIFSLPLTAQHIASSTQTAEGKHLFEMNCSVGYCHGLEGRASKGPRLRDRVWSRSYLSHTIEKGIPNSSMPAWQGRLTRENIDAVVSYIISISHEQTSPVTTDNRSSAVTAQPILEKDAVLGKALFFDPLKDRNCGVCHRVAGNGTPVAPDLRNLAKRSNNLLLSQIEGQPSEGKIIQVRLKEGDTVYGPEAHEASGVLHVYDLAGVGPPVLRSIDRASIAEEEPCRHFNVHSNNSRDYNRAELASIIVFLRSIE